ncbi:MAG: nucleoside triphosphate pyrophosphohydrolase [Alphaproteobacteria bacterium]|nr:nucleoside triphosphate pyrophosphohydrolase [Alphaproteobacteria bacterium]
MKKRLDKLISKLRDEENGCSWNTKQTHNTLLPYLIEETYELVDAIKNNENIKEELSDLLFQILIHSKIEEEKGNFNIDDVIDNLSQKIIRRHPHVFKNKKKLTDEQLNEQWNSIKMKEGKRNSTSDPFYTINKSLTSILKALEIGNISKRYKFDWNNYKGPLNKVKEEINEVIEAKEKTNNIKLIEEEIGDLMFSIVSLARHLDINPDIALEQANIKFIKRFNLMLQEFENKREFIKSSNKIKENIWKKIKKL